MKRVPICRLDTWALKHSRPDSIRMRPTVSTLLRRLPWCALLAAFAVGIWFSADSQLAGLTTDAEEQSRRRALHQDRIERELTERINAADPEEAEELRSALARNRSRTATRRAPGNGLRASYTYARNIGTAVFAVLAAIPLVTMPLARLTLRRDARGNLRFFYWNYLPMWRTVSPGAFDTMAIYVTEDMSYHRKWGLTHRGWVWVAQPQTGEARIVPMLGMLAFGVNSAPVFILDRQRSAPSDNPPLPERVHNFVTAFHRLTGLPFSAPVVAESSLSVDRWGRGTIRRRTTVPVSEPTVTCRVYRSVDEVPEQFRAQFEALKLQAEREGDGIYSSTSQRITVMNADGTQTTYESLEDMPPELRERFRRFMK